MSSPGFAQSKGTHEDPPDYNVIAPYAPPDSYPPVTPSPEADLASMKGVPPGLAPLLQINQLSMREKFKTSQGWGRSFEVLNASGQRLFQVEESVVCCGPLYDVTVKDNGGADVMQFLENCGCTCTRQMGVLSTSGCPIGFVKLHWNNLVTHLSILNASGELVLLVLGPSFQASIFGNATFEIKSTDEQHVIGMIRMETDSFLVTFPLDLEVTVKALLFGAAMYLGNLIHTKRKNVERNARRRN